MNKTIFFTGAGISAESGVPTYRGRGGVWKQYNYEEYACQEAFDRNPKKVIEFHKVRRKAVGFCKPNAGHLAITAMQGATIITQNIDGLHQRAGSKTVIELHGSLWKNRCNYCDETQEIIPGKFYYKTLCNCGRYYRPDIVWFGDSLKEHNIRQAMHSIEHCETFISIGTSGAVWPAAGFPELAKSHGAMCIEINPEPTELSYMFDECIREKASVAVPKLVKRMLEK